MTYELVYATLLFGGFLAYGRPPARRAIYWLVLIGLFIFVGFRYRVGCDWTSYESIFNEYRWSPIELVGRQIEPGFAAANLLLHDLGLEYPYINVVSAAFFFVGLHVLAQRQPDPLGLLILSFPVLILNVPMSAIRQAIAIGFICIAFTAFVDRKLLRYVVFVGVAALFHYSAAIFLLIAPFVGGDISRQNIARGVILALPGAYFLATSEIAHLYEHRYTTGIASEAAGAPFRAALVSLTGAVFLLFLQHRWAKFFPKDHKLVLIGAYIMLGAFPVALFSSVIGDRFAYYLNPLQLMILARLSCLFRGPHSALILFLPYAAGGLVLLVWIQFSALFDQCYNPYQFWK